MYQVTVTPQFLSGKDTFRQAVPALSWAVLIFATFILMCVFDLYIFVIPLLLEFISVIPMGIWSVKRSKKNQKRIRQTNNNNTHSKKRRNIQRQYKAQLIV